MSKSISMKKFFTPEEIKFFARFKKPSDIQLFLNNVKYNPEYKTSSPGRIIHTKEANCFEGALFAAAALRMLGHPPLIVDFMAHNDDDHVIALFKHNNLYGAVAKSNTTTLRFREPVYRTLRELILSYFEFYINTIGDKSLRSYSNPVNLSRFDKYNWMNTEADLEFIGDYLFTIKHHPIIYKKSLRNLSSADNDFINLCFSGSIPEGLFTPKQKKK
jgi:hypothetical protein